MTTSKNEDSTPKPESGQPASPQTWSQLLHDVRNLLNTIKLNCAVLQRVGTITETARESLRDIDQSADHIDALVTQFPGERPK